MSKNDRQHAPRDRKRPITMPKPPCTPEPPRFPPPPRPAGPGCTTGPDFRSIFKPGRRGRH
jgi:hypothetical protein